MKFSRLTLMLTAMVLAAVVALASTACSTVGTQHQQIAAACEASASAADAIAIAAQAGRVTKAQAQQALGIYRTTVPFCQPVPVASLSSVDYQALILAAAQLTSIREKAS